MITTFVFHDRGNVFVIPEGWIPGAETEEQGEVYPGQAKGYDATLYACVVRAGVESVMRGGEIEIWPAVMRGKR